MADPGYTRDSVSDQKPSDPATGQTTSGTGTAFDAIEEINAYEKEYQKWEQRGKQIIRRYRDERSEATNLRVVSRKFNVLWSNTETLKPTLYARLPRVQVERRFKDADPTGRVACEISERLGNYLLETSPYQSCMKLAVQDLLLPGRAIIWINYRAELSTPEQPADSDESDETSADDDANDDEAGETELEKIWEKVEPIYVDWRDFGHSPKRTWQEVIRGWRISYMTRPELIERFGDKLGAAIPLDKNADSTNEKQPDSLHDTASIYEVWDKKNKKVCWVHKTQKDYLDESDPPVMLEEFWPFPRPLWANITNDTLVPVPYYALYQDQASELDKITNRIGRFSDALKLVGVYDASVPELARLLSPNGTPDNMLIPVANYGGLKEAGGIQGAVDLLPLGTIAETLLQLYQARDQVLNVIYQVTGIADVIRGASDPSETATAQALKGQFGSLRIRDLQAEVARFARDAARIVVEMALQMYEPETIYEMVQGDAFTELTPQEQQRAQIMQRFGMPAPKPMQQFAEALRMLRDDKMRSFHVDIETDSTIAMNDQEEKQNVTEFLTALGSFIQSFGPMVQQMPQLMPVAGEALLYATRRYRAGRSLETAIEKAVGQIAQMTQQPKPPGKEQIELQTATVKGQAEQARAQADIAGAKADTTKAMIEAQTAQADGALKAAQVQTYQQEQARKNRDQQLEAQGQQFDQTMAVRQQKHNEAVDTMDAVAKLMPRQPRPVH